MSKRWQYLIKAHVPAAKSPSDWKEQITLDKWEPKYPPMKRGIGLVLSAAILAGSCFLVPPSYGTNFSNPALPDKWEPTYVDYHYQKPTLSRAIQPTNAVVVPPVAPSDWKERITIDKWEPTYVDYHYKKSFLSRAIQSGSLFWVYWPPPVTEIVTTDKWIPNYPNQLLPKIGLSRAIQSGSFFKGTPWNAASALETITIDKWFGNIPAYLFQKATLSKAIQSGSFFSMWPIVGAPPGPTYTIRELVIAAIDTRFKLIVTPDTFNAIRQRIVDAIDSRCKTILIAGGYKMNLGSNVFAWRTTPIQSSEIPALVYRDRTETREPGWGYFQNKLPIEIEIYAHTPAEIRECIADLEKTIYTDDTWGSLALCSDMDINEMEIEQKEDMFVGTRILLTVTYRTVFGDPYTKG
jgi:hypothetical protein